MLKRASAAAVTAALIALSLAGCAPAEGPEDVLKDYLTAISEGKATDALKLVEHADQDDAPLLTDDVLGAATERISDIQVGKEAAPEGADYEVSDSGGNIPYAYDLAGETFYGAAPLFKSEDGTWKVDGLPGDGSILGTLRVTASSSDLLAGANIGDTGAPVDSTLLVFPAVYAPEGVPAEGFEAQPVQPVSVTGNDGATVTVEVEPGQELIESAIVVAQKFVDGCAAATSEAPEVNGISCPFSTRGSEQIWEDARALTTGWTGIEKISASSCKPNVRNESAVVVCEYSAPSAVFTEAPAETSIMLVGEVSRASDDQVTFRPVVVDLLSLSVGAK